MKRLNGYRMRLVLVGVVAGMLLEGGSVKADFTFGEPTNLGTNVNSSSCEMGLSISSDGLSIIFSSDRPTMGQFHLYITTRETTKDEWSPAVNFGWTVNRPLGENYPSISTDGLELYYCSAFGTGRGDLFVTTRPTIHDDWGEPMNLGESVNALSFNDTEPSVSADGLELHFSSDRPGGYGEWNIWVTKRQTKNDPWEEPVNLGPTINSGGTARTPNISSDGLVLIFSDYCYVCDPRPGGHGRSDIWLSTRKSKEDSWQEPVNLGPPVNTSGRELSPCISHDGSMLYFSSYLSGGYGCLDLWQAPILPVVDLNGDGIVDSADMVIMVDNWGTDNSLCDIGPMPWGDGVVDVQDLIVLSEHLFEEVQQP